MIKDTKTDKKAGGKNENFSNSICCVDGSRDGANHHHLEQENEMIEHDYKECPYAIFKHTGRPICVKEGDYCHKVKICEIEIAEVPAKPEVDIGWK